MLLYTLLFNMSFYKLVLWILAIFIGINFRCCNSSADYEHAAIA